MPYLLLAAFYFFGFAMGMFNNSTGDEAVETISALTIPAEVSPKITNEFTYFYQLNPENKQVQSENSDIDYTPFRLFPDTGLINCFVRSKNVNEVHYSGFIFSRPPPSAC